MRNAENCTFHSAVKRTKDSIQKEVSNLQSIQQTVIEIFFGILSNKRKEKTKKKETLNGKSINQRKRRSNSVCVFP